MDTLHLPVLFITGTLLGMLGSIITTLKEDLRNAREHDPAARGDAENALVYSGLHAIWAYRVAHCWWERGWKGPARILSQFTRFMTCLLYTSPSPRDRG